MCCEAVKRSVLEVTKPVQMSYIPVWRRSVKRGQRELNKGIKARQEGQERDGMQL